MKDLFGLLIYIIKKYGFIIVVAIIMVSPVMNFVLKTSLSDIQLESSSIVNLINEKKEFILFTATALVLLVLLSQ
ncbi:hypothetical protein [Escherichia coli]|uniref:hypothetical protein n=1 Tax=Escherichia coli TaxID=562 RepID=UPI001F106A12|nr:hypothetical protein [Escherichia coli]